MTSLYWIGAQSISKQAAIFKTHEGGLDKIVCSKYIQRLSGRRSLHLDFYFVFLLTCVPEEIIDDELTFNWQAPNRRQAIPWNNVDQYSRRHGFIRLHDSCTGLTQDIYVLLTRNTSTCSQTWADHFKYLLFRGDQNHWVFLSVDCLMRHRISTRQKHPMNYVYNNNTARAKWYHLHQPGKEVMVI